MSRFYVPPEAVKNGKIYAGKDESRHISSVMRLKEGDEVTVFDGSGKEYTGRIESVRNKNVIINIEKTVASPIEPSVRVTLAQVLIKKDKMDYIVEKATELGALEIIPLETGRTVVRPDKAAGGHKFERWQRIAIEAAKQCGRRDLPKIKKINTFDEMLDIFPQYDMVLMPCLSEETIPLNKAITSAKDPKNILLLIGPEGDFTPDEIERARQKGAILVSLGNLVLKSDTAAVAALAMINYAFL
ncbi:MAG: 16S rRNA (uracil(1498)-N(3))-methyltransferase [Candidatus Omnitrophota bacterium]